MRNEFSEIDESVSDLSRVQTAVVYVHVPGDAGAVMDEREFLESMIFKGDSGHVGD